MNIRARFEEIWPVPAGVCWCVVDGGYFAESTEHIPNSMRHNARLDTFTRCQETTDVYVSLVDECLKELDCIYHGVQHQGWSVGCSVPTSIERIKDRAKQIMEQKK